MQVVCPILNVNEVGASGGSSPSVVNPVSNGTSIGDALEKPETVVSQDTQTGNFDEGFIQIKNTRIYGLRTYSIILIIVLVYSYLCIRSMDTLGMKDLALMACGFLFGVKAIKR